MGAGSLGYDWTLQVHRSAVWARQQRRRARRRHWAAPLATARESLSVPMREQATRAFQEQQQALLHMQNVDPARARLLGKAKRQMLPDQGTQMNAPCQHGLPSCDAQEKDRGETWRLAGCRGWTGFA